ncbi:hypothetical protein EBZ70_11900 [bacterium]|jgi:hypothetical protein|nr:hypothetical protein [bacterium]
MLVAALLTACGNSFSGQYTDTAGIATYTFRPNGTVTVATMGIEYEMPYAFEDDRIKLGNPGSGPSVLLTLQKDGTIVAPMGVILHKK